MSIVSILSAEILYYHELGWTSLVVIANVTIFNTESSVRKIPSIQNQRFKVELSDFYTHSARISRFLLIILWLWFFQRRFSSFIFIYENVFPHFFLKKLYSSQSALLRFSQILSRLFSLMWFLKPSLFIFIMTFTTPLRYTKHNATHTKIHIRI